MGWFFLLVFTLLAGFSSWGGEDYSNKFIILPLAYYTPETGPAGGLVLIKNFWKEREGRTSHIVSYFSITGNNQTMFSLAPKMYFSQGEWDLGGSIFYSYYPNKFYGRDSLNPQSQPEKYVENNFLSNANAGKNIFSDLYFRLGVSYDQRKIVDYSAGGLIDGEIQNIAKNLEVQSFQAGLEWDRRDYPQAPIEGSWYRITQTWSSPRDKETARSLSAFRKIDFDFRQYAKLDPLWGVAGQLLVSEIQGDQVPLQYLNSIGGGARLRGYYAGQRRDMALVMTQVEFRYEWRDRWVGSIFGGGARLAGDLDRMSDSESLYSGGVGIHYLIDPENRTKLRFDLGFADKNSGVYFLIGEAF